MSEMAFRSRDLLPARLVGNIYRDAIGKSWGDGSWNLYLGRRCAG